MSEQRASTSGPDPATPEQFVGIDVAQATLDVAIAPTGSGFRVTNDPAGLVQLVERMQHIAPVLIVLEATGGYERVAVGELLSAGLPATVVNPRQVRDFAKATGRLAKTDRLDAAVLAHFA